MKYAAIRTAFEGLWLSQLPALIRKMSSARGLIFTLHRVLPGTPAPFSPNAILQVEPEYLDYVIERMRGMGFDIVSMDEALDRLAVPEGSSRPFVVLTFDDAYRDNLQHALPILRRHEAPFTLYVPPGFVDGVGQLWWQAIEDIIAAQDSISLAINGRADHVETRTRAQKRQAYHTLYWQMRRMPEDERVELMRNLASAYGYDLGRQCSDLIMDWDELREFHDEELCTLGAHTVYHYELAKLPRERAWDEMVRSADILQEQFGVRPAHFSYPIGGAAAAGVREFELAREVGFRSGVTTRPGGLYARHLETPHALPRISLNGNYQARRHVEVFATGAIFSTMGKLAS